MDCTMMLLILSISLFELVSGYVKPHAFVGITGGGTIPIENAPFMASLVRFFKAPGGAKHYDLCGGSIVHERFILTAAHCLEGESDLDVVRVGSSKHLEGGKVYAVEKMIAHESYLPDEIDLEYDVGLIKLKTPVKFSRNVLKVDLADNNVNIDPGTRVNITGWGKTGVKGHVSQELRQVSVPIKSNENCIVYPWVSPDEICIWSFHKGSCKGDSGGPMTIGNVQVGIVSNGLACGFLPSVFVKVSKMLPWIDETIKQNLYP